MAPKPDSGKLTRRKEIPPESVDAFLAALDHPLKEEIKAVRQIILAADPAITEGIKWNVPSYRTTEWFATLHLRSMVFVQVILHRGAKPRDVSTSGIAIADPDALLEWLAKDRAAVKFHTLADISGKQSAFLNLIREWILFV